MSRTHQLLLIEKHPFMVVECTIEGRGRILLEERNLRYTKNPTNTTITINCKSGFWTNTSNPYGKREWKWQDGGLRVVTESTDATIECKAPNGPFLSEESLATHPSCIRTSRVYFCATLDVNAMPWNLTTRRLQMNTGAYRLYRSVQIRWLCEAPNGHKDRVRSTVRTQQLSEVITSIHPPCVVCIIPGEGEPFHSFDSRRLLIIRVNKRKGFGGL